MNVFNDAIAAMEASQDDTGREQGRSSSLELGAMAAGAAAAEAAGQGRGAVDEDEELEEEDGDVVMADGVGNEVGGQSGENEVVAGAPEGPKEQPVVRLSRSRRPHRKKKVVEEEWVPSDEESEFIQELATAANEDISDADDSFLDDRDAKLAKRRDKKRAKREKEDRIVRKSGSYRRQRGVRKDRVLGRLTRALRDLPNEIFCSILSLCDVRTLLALSRSSREFYNFFHSKESSKSTWQAAWRVSGLETPFVSQEWNEPMYAALVYGDVCEICGKKAPTCNFDFRMRVCKACAYKPRPKRRNRRDPVAAGPIDGEGVEDAGEVVRDLIVCSPNLDKMDPFPGQEFTAEVVQCILSSDMRICEWTGYPWVNHTYYLQASIEDVCGQVRLLVHQDLIDALERKSDGVEEPEIEGEEEENPLDESWRRVPGRVGVYLRGLRAESKRALQDTTNLKKLITKAQKEAHQEKRDIAEEREYEIRRRLMEDEGFTFELMNRAFARGSPISHIINAKYPLTDRAWNGCKNEIIQTLCVFQKFPTLEAIKAYRETLGGPFGKIEQKVEDHMLALQRRMNRYGYR